MQAHTWLLEIAFVREVCIRGCVRVSAPRTISSLKSILVCVAMWSLVTCFVLFRILFNTTVQVQTIIASYSPHYYLSVVNACSHVIVNNGSLM